MGSQLSSAAVARRQITKPTPRAWSLACPQWRINLLSLTIPALPRQRIFHSGFPFKLSKNWADFPTWIKMRTFRIPTPNFFWVEDWSAHRAVDDLTASLHRRYRQLPIIFVRILHFMRFVCRFLASVFLPGRVPNPTPNPSPFTHRLETGKAEFQK